MFVSLLYSFLKFAWLVLASIKFYPFNLEHPQTATILIGPLSFFLFNVIIDAINKGIFSKLLVWYFSVARYKHILSVK